MGALQSSRIFAVEIFSHRYVLESCPGYELHGARVVQREANAERDAVEQKARQRSQKAAATRAVTLAKEAAVNAEKLKSATCMSCFQVRTPAGTCGCDE